MNLAGLRVLSLDQSSPGAVGNPSCLWLIRRSGVQAWGGWSMASWKEISTSCARQQGVLNERSQRSWLGAARSRNVECRVQK